MSATNELGLISRTEASRLGLKRFFEGAPCRNGHIAARRVSDLNCVVCSREARCRWAKKHPKTHADKNRSWNDKNRPKTRRACGDWKRKNPDQVNALNNRRRARKISAAGSYTADDVRRIFKLQRERCARCGVLITLRKPGRHSRRRKASVDHIVPLERGGSNFPKNIQLLCHLCNSAKGVRDPIEDARRVGRLI